MFDLIFIFYDCYNHCFFLFLHSFPVLWKKYFLLLWDSSPLKDEYSYSHKSQFTQGKESGRERKMDIKAWNLGSNFKAVIWLKKFRLPYRTFLPFSVIFVTFRTPHFSDGCGGEKNGREKEQLSFQFIKTPTQTAPPPGEMKSTQRSWGSARGRLCFSSTADRKLK